MFWDNFVALCNENGTKPNPVAKELGISSGSVTFWKNGKVPHHSTLLKIADYFDVSVDYLLTGADTMELPLKDGVVLDNDNLRMIPLFESVSAGFGAYADSTILEYVPLFIQSKSEADETICIRVQGNSMSPKIENGDIIQVRKQTSVDSGSIAVVLIGGEEGFVKKVNYGDDWIELISLNPNYPSMRFEGESVTKIQVVGLVKKVTKEI